MHRKSILLLGGSAQQTVAIKAAGELGYRVVLCDYLPDNPGRHYADSYYNVSTTDIEAVYKVAEDEKVSGILAYASDPAALPAAVVCERLGLPTNPAESVEILGVKHKFREFLRDNGFACPKAYTFSPSDSITGIAEAVRSFTFPIVIKPTDSSGSKGVTVLDAPDGLEKAVEYASGYSNNKIIIAEEFIRKGFPEVIGGDIFIRDGVIEIFGLMSCLRKGRGTGLIPIGKLFPAGLTAGQEDNIKRELQNLVSMLGIRFGEMNVEIILDEQDKVHFLELGPRAGGNMIPLQLTDALGVDLVKANVTAAMGESPDLRMNRKEGCFMTHVLNSDTCGKFKGVAFSPEIEPCIYRKVFYKKAGDPVETFDGAGKALGIIFMHIDTEARMRDFAGRIDELVKIVLE